MKSKLVSVLVFCMCSLTAFPYAPRINGAKADLLLILVDNEGCAVSNAQVSVMFYITPEKVEVKDGWTDERGRFGICGNTIGEIRAWIRKDGYYDTKLHPNFQTLTDEDAAKMRAWSKKTVQNVVTIKKKQKPIKLHYAFNCFQPFPATNIVVKLDLEQMKWCPPYGDGKNDDVHLLLDAKRNPKVWGDFYTHLTLFFPNCVDGFYRCKLDSTSDFKYAYNAQPNAQYDKTLKLRFARTPNAVTNRVALAKDEYLIYRIRTQTNEFGQVTSAHYGRINERMSQLIGLSLQSLYNPNENDTNLEDTQSVAW